MLNLTKCNSAIRKPETVRLFGPSCNANLQPAKHYRTTLNLFKRLQRNCYWNGQKDANMARLVRLEFERFRWQQDQNQINLLKQQGEKHLHNVYKLSRNKITKDITWFRRLGTTYPDGTPKSIERQKFEWRGMVKKIDFPSYEKEQMRAHYKSNFYHKKDMINKKLSSRNNIGKDDPRLLEEPSRKIDQWREQPILKESAEINRGLKGKGNEGMGLRAPTLKGKTIVIDE